jgi:hypothetical protein
MTELPAGSGIGAWAGDDLAATVHDNFGAGSGAGLPPEVRFLSGVAELARKRRATTDAKDDPILPAVFLLRPSPPEDLAEAVMQFPMVDNGRESITGRLWFVNENVCNGSCIDLDPSQTDAQLFARVCSLSGAANLPTVLFDPRPTPPTIRFYQSGLGDPNDCRVQEFMPEQDIDLEQVFRAVSQIHESFLITPDNQPVVASLWADKARGWPVEQAERLIQWQLQIGLTQTFLPCVVRPEQPSILGRLDLQIERPDSATPGNVTIFAVLELKVLRTYWSGGRSVSEVEIADWIEKGVQQAGVHKTNRHAIAAALCCFDMRRDVTGDACFEPVRSLSERLGVALRKWHLFSSSEAARAYLTR